ncbi:MAG: VWA domain-containing protein, partial [Bacteroidales bacterium]|nr:VWA domain-containing protein [Bacteroidales bacterium]
MFGFERSQLLFALCLIPVFVAWYVWQARRQRKVWARFGEESLLDGLMPLRSRRMKTFKGVLHCLIYALLVIALANPQMGTGVEKGKRRGMDLMFCVDVSNSMLARDYTPNRLAAVRQGMLSLVDRLGGDRIGLVVFAGKAFVQLPVTSDYAAARMFISAMSTRSVSEQGTDLAGAIDKAAVSMLPSEGSAQAGKASKVGKVMVVVSDGEDHAEDAVEMAQAAAARGITIYTVGIGSAQGEPIPAGESGGFTSYKKDKDGNTVITRLNESLLKEIAAAGKGSYIHASNAMVSFDRLYDELSRLEKSDLEDVTYTRHQTVFYIPLALALLLLLLDVLLPDKKLVRWSEIRWLNPKRAGLWLLCMLWLPLLQAQSPEALKHLRQGNRMYLQGTQLERQAQKAASQRGDLQRQKAEELSRQAQQKYRRAMVDYMKSEQSEPYYKTAYNLANTLYKQGSYEEAAKRYESVAATPGLDAKTKAWAYHNLGNSLVRQKRYQEGIQAYKKALRMNPKDMSTKYNLEYARKKLAVQQQQQ